MTKTIPILPPRRVHKTPRLLMSDAYTIGSNEFESEEAKQQSIYYVLGRRELSKINPTLYKKGDNRMVFAGLQRIMEELFYEPVTHEEIDAAKEYLDHYQITTNGLAPYTFPEKIWRDIVDKYEGRIPIEVMALPEGSVFYPGEPAIQVRSLVPGWGILAAWFEQAILHTWAPTERVTQSEHWLAHLTEKFRKIDPSLDDHAAYMAASSMLTDFGARAAICEQETEILGMYGLITFAGTDSTSGGFQAWMNSDKTPGLSISVKALAHRNVQAYENEGDCYRAIYEAAKNGEITSEVADCYNYFRAVEDHLLPLAIRSRDEGRNVVVTARPDSGDALQQVLWTVELAVANGLYYEKEIGGKKWKCGTWLRFIEGDGMSFEAMDQIIDALIERGYIPWEWGLFGQGGGQRNGLKRDNTGWKYALCAVGKSLRGVVKLSETLGKTTNPGPFKVLRTPEALAAKKTVVHISEPGENAMVLYYYGIRLEKPFDIGQEENFITIKNRVRENFHKMPLNLDTPWGAPVSDKIREMRKELIQKYDPTKDLSNY